MIKLDYKSGKPLHEQISCGIKELIISGVLPPDEQLPSVRELSVSLTVNPNTVQHAYKSLESEGIIYSLKGKGNFVARVQRADESRVRELKSTIVAAVKELAFLGQPKGEIEDIIRTIYLERDEEQ